MPYYKSGVQVEKNAVYFKLQSKVGIVVMWNGEDAVMVTDSSPRSLCKKNEKAEKSLSFCLYVVGWTGLWLCQSYMWTLWRLQWHFCPWWVHSKWLEAFSALWLSFTDFALADIWLRSIDRKISPIEFGNNHKVHLPNDDCEDPYEEDEESAETETLLDSCKEFVSFLFKIHFGILSKRSQILKKLSSTCLFFPHQRTTCEQMLRSGSWSSCTSLIDPEAYIQACVQDMCGCTNTTDYFCICSTLSEFSRQCSHAGGQPPNWRTPQFCGKMFTFTSVIYEIIWPHLWKVHL